MRKSLTITIESKDSNTLEQMESDLIEYATDVSNSYAGSVAVFDGELTPTRRDSSFMNKREVALRIHLCGMKPHYWIHFDMPNVVKHATDVLHVYSMAHGNAIVRALRSIPWPKES